MNTAMQPSGNEIKRAALTEHRRSGRLGAQQVRLLQALGDDALCRHEIAERTGILITSVCGRCRELLDLDAIAPDGTTDDPRPRQRLALTEHGRALLDALQAAEEESHDAHA